MTTQGYYAVLVMCAIVIVSYAIRNGEAHYLPDLLALALALAAPNQTLGIAAWIVVVLIRHTPIGYGLASTLPYWLLPIVLPAADRYMSIEIADSQQLEAAYKSRILAQTAKTERIEIPEPVAENEAEKVISDKYEIMALSVLTGSIGKTEAVRLLAGAKGGSKYQAAKRALDIEIDRQRNHYPATSTLKRYD